MSTRGLMYIKTKGNAGVGIPISSDAYWRGAGVDILRALKSEREKYGVCDEEEGFAEYLDSLLSGIHPVYDSISSVSMSVTKMLEAAFVGATFPVTDVSYFAADSLFCEYVYVIDTELGKFMIFFGGNREETKPDEYFYHKRGFCQKGYGCVKQVAEYPLDDLPDERSVADLLQMYHSYLDGGISKQEYDKLCAKEDVSVKIHIKRRNGNIEVIKKAVQHMYEAYSWIKETLEAHIFDLSISSLKAYIGDDKIMEWKCGNSIVDFLISKGDCNGCDK